MRELIKAKLELKDRHSKFVKDANGKDVPIPDDGVVFAYIDEYGILHASEYADIASTYGNGKFMITDEITAKNGYPVYNGTVYTIYGAGEDYVYLSKNKAEDAKYHTANYDSATKKIVYNQSNTQKMIELGFLRPMYLELEQA